MGAALRGARLSLGWTLRDVARRSGGRFKPSVLSLYERGERGLSLRRFCELARFYGIPPDRLLGHVLGEMTPEARSELVIDLNGLTLITDDDGRVVAEFVHRVRSQRRDYMTDVVTLRGGDLEELGLLTHEDPRHLLRRLGSALRTSPFAGQPAHYDHPQRVRPPVREPPAATG